MDSKSLEEKLKPDWKQWAPVYGLIQIYKDSSSGKPTIMDNSYAGIYHGITLGASILGAAYCMLKLTEKLF